jgi:hypothetical protein
MHQAFENPNKTNSPEQQATSVQRGAASSQCCAGTSPRKTGKHPDVHASSVTASLVIPRFKTVSRHFNSGFLTPGLSKRTTAIPSLTNATDKS